MATTSTAPAQIQDDIELEVLPTEMRFHLKHLTPSNTLRAADANLLSDNKQIACVVSLFGWTSKTFVLESKAKAVELIDQVYAEMKLMDSVEKDYFSVFYYDRTHKVFLDPLKNLKDHKVPKLGKGKNAPYSLHFGVKFYLAQPKVMDQYARYLYSLQLCEDIKANRVPVDFEMATKLTALLVQVAVGDYDPAKHQPGYTKPLERLYLVPAAYRPKNYETDLITEHQKLVGLSCSRAEYQFTERARQLPCYGCHLFPAHDENHNAVLIGISYRGISVFRDGTEADFIKWLDMSKIQYRGKLFFIKYHPNSNDEKKGNENGEAIVYKLCCDNRSSAKRVWTNAIEQHTFFKRNKADGLTRIASFIKRGTGFRYSGVTLRQIRTMQKERPKSQPFLSTQAEPTSMDDNAMLSRSIQANTEVQMFLEREHKVMQKAFPDQQDDNEELRPEGEKTQQNDIKKDDLSNEPGNVSMLSTDTALLLRSSNSPPPKSAIEESVEIPTSRL